MDNEITDLPIPSDTIDTNKFLPKEESNTIPTESRVAPVGSGVNFDTPLDRTIQGLNSEPLGLIEGAALSYSRGIFEGIDVHSAIDNKLNADSKFEEGKRVLNEFDVKFARPPTTAQRYIGWFPDSIIQYMGNVTAAPETVFTALGAGKVVKKGFEYGESAFKSAFPKTAEKIGSILEKPLAELFNTELPIFAGEKTFGKLVSQNFVIYSEATAGMIPIEAANNYNSKTKEFDISGTIRDANKIGELALEINGGAFLAGTILGKAKMALWGGDIAREAHSVEKNANFINEYTIAHSEGKVNPDFINNFLREKEAGKVDPRVFEWYDKYKDNPHSEEAIKEGNKIISDRHEANSPFMKAFQKAHDEGKVDPKVFAWYQKYHYDPHSEEALKEANQILQSQGHKVNHVTNSVNIKILNETDVKSLNSVMGDQLFSDVPHEIKKNLSDVIAHNATDKIVGNHELIDGIKGVIHYFNDRIKNFGKHKEELYKLVDKNYTGHFNKSHTLSQESILKNLLKFGDIERDYIIPENIKKRYSQQIKLKIIEKEEKFINKDEKLKSYFHGDNEFSKSKSPHEYKNIGAGYWITEDREIAEKYSGKINEHGKRIENVKEHKLSENIKLYDIDENSDLELRKYYKKGNVEEFRREAKIKGYKGIIKDATYRPLKNGNQRRDIMLFENPNSSFDIKNNLESILNHKEEIKYLEDKLIKKGKVSHKLDIKHEYQRLKELAKYSIPARGLMHKVELLNEKAKQEAFKGILETYAKLHDANLEKMANVKNASDYLRTRIESDFKKGAIPEEVRVIEEEFRKRDKPPPTDSDEILDQQRESIDKIDSDRVKDQYDEAVDRFKQHKENQSVFKQFIDCVLNAAGK